MKKLFCFYYFDLFEKKINLNEGLRLNDANNNNNNNNEFLTSYAVHNLVKNQVLASIKSTNRGVDSHTA